MGGSAGAGGTETPVMVILAVSRTTTWRPPGRPAVAALIVSNLTDSPVGARTKFRTTHTSTPRAASHRRCLRPCCGEGGSEQRQVVPVRGRGDKAEGNAVAVAGDRAFQPAFAPVHRGWAGCLPAVRCLGHASIHGTSPSCRPMTCYLCTSDQFTHDGGCDATALARRCDGIAQFGCTVQRGAFPASVADQCSVLA
jgi:hypothetical protein